MAVTTSNARASMREHVDPPVSFGGSGGIIWSLGPNALSQIPATRRPRTDPSAPSALRLRASAPAVTLAECGRRVDPRESADPPPGLELAGPDLPARPAIEAETEDDGDASSSENADAARKDAGFVDLRVSFEATEAQSALDTANVVPVGVPRRALEARLRESARAAREADDPRRGGVSRRRLGNALAVAPWPRDGSSETSSSGLAADVMLARAAGEGAARVRVARLVRGATARHPDASFPRGAAERRRKSAPAPSGLRVAADLPLPTRSASQPVLQVELARVSHGWIARFADDAQPALCAARDPYGVSLSVLGGGARAVPTRGSKPRRIVSFARDSPIDPSPSPELLWSCAWNGFASAPADIKLSPHGLPELLVASRDGGLRVVDAAACDAAGGAKRMKKTKHALRRAARVAATPAATRDRVDASFGAGGEGGTGDFGWCGCAYASSPRVALLATSRLVRSVDLRERPSAGTVLAEPLVGDAPWRALAGPPVAAWSPSSFPFSFGSHGGSHDARSSGFERSSSASSVASNAFALACDRHVALYDVRKPDAPVARWAHGAASSPAWLRLEPSAPWRASFSPSTNPYPGALVLAGHGGADGGVLAFEWEERPEEASDGSLSGNVRALGAGARVPLAEDDSAEDDLCGFATLPPALSPSGLVPGGMLWATRDGRVRWRGYEPESPAGGAGTERSVSPAAPLAFRADGRSVSRADGEDGEDGDGEMKASLRDAAEDPPKREGDAFRQSEDPISDDDEEADGSDASFVSLLEKLHRERGGKLRDPIIFCGRKLDLPKLFAEVQSRGGSEVVTKHRKWKQVARAMCGDLKGQTGASHNIKSRFLEVFQGHEERLAEKCISPELARALGAAAGVAAADPPRVSLREMDDATRRACDAATARAAAEGAARAAAAAGRADGASFLAGNRSDDRSRALRSDISSPAARLPGRIVKKKTTFPLVAGFIARGAVPGETPARGIGAGGGGGAPETSPAAKAGGEKKVLARAAALARAAGGFGVTAHELAHLAACARGDGGGAADVAEWLASRDLAGRKRSRTQAPGAEAKARARREAEAYAGSAFAPGQREEREARLPSDEDVPKTLARTRLELGRAFPCVWHHDDERRDETDDLIRPLEGNGTARGDVALLAAVVGASDDDDDALRARARDAPHTEWLRASARWVGACARTAGRTTYALHPSPSPLHPAARGDDRAEASDAARAALLASWPDPSSADASERAPAPVRLESRLKKKPPRGADPKRVSRDERRVSWDVPPAAPRAPAATPRTEPKPRRRTEKTMRAPRRAGV